MRCLLGCLAMLTPRAVIMMLVAWTDYIGTAFTHWAWPLLGFIFLPVTTLAAAVANHELRDQPIFYYPLIVAALLLDLGAFGGGAWGTSHARK